MEIITEEEIQKRIGRGKDLRKSNKDFGRLKILYPLKRENGERRLTWHCLCECGKECDVTAAHLNNGHTKSCGCLGKENALKNLTKGREIKDLTKLNPFGKLRALEATDKRNGTNVIWKCQCECGNIVFISGDSLTGGRSTSCGCFKKSKGELKIEKILKENNISFEQQKTFDTCRFPDTGALARFDFYVNNKYLIEYDGIQHFKEGKGVIDNKEKFLKTQQHDEYKNQWCKNNGIPLIRIPYIVKNIDLEDLLISSQYLI